MEIRKQTECENCIEGEGKKIPLVALECCAELCDVMATCERHEVVSNIFLTDKN